MLSVYEYILWYTYLCVLCACKCVMISGGGVCVVDFSTHLSFYVWRPVHVDKLNRG